MTDESVSPSTVRHPTRSADRNRDLLDRADPASDGRLLPSLDDGITLLDVDGGRGVPVLQALVLDHLLLHDGPAFWVDADGHATTTTLARAAPSQRLLDRIHVARGFTAYQHYGATCALSDAVNHRIRETASNAGPPRPGRDRSATESSPHTPALVVAPALDAQYRADDTLGECHAQTLQARTLARLATYAASYDIPVLVTRSETDAFTDPIETAADHRLTCEQTALGPRFVGDEFETLVYPVDGGAYYQTTLAYWRQLLDARAAQVGVEPTGPDRPMGGTSGTGGAGTGVTADGGTATLTANPLLDAWAGGGGR